MVYALLRMIALWSVCQRYNLKAIHNFFALLRKFNLVVIGMSKIQSESNSQRGNEQPLWIRGCDRYVKDTIWKQFTTPTIAPYCAKMLWSVCQRYNLKAIHNPLATLTISIPVVIGMSKIQSESNSQQRPRTSFEFRGCDRYVKDTIWKQFTTTNAFAHDGPGLWSVCQRYNLKAIHNRGWPTLPIPSVVIGMSKIQSESNSQLPNISQYWFICCDRYVKDTIWKQFTTPQKFANYLLKLWSVCQRYNLKAIHNTSAKRNASWKVVIGMSKIQSESNSQHQDNPKHLFGSCDRYVKDTIWKQFTTLITISVTAIMLWSVCQRYNLKAIHNSERLRREFGLVVIGMSKIQSESNSQPGFDA